MFSVHSKFHFRENGFLLDCLQHFKVSIEMLLIFNTVFTSFFFQEFWKEEEKKSKPSQNYMFGFCLLLRNLITLSETGLEKGRCLQQTKH